MPMNFVDLPMEQQQKILTMGLQQFRSGAPATKENMNRMREILVSDPAYARQIMTDAGLGGYGGGDESSWVNPAQMAYSPDTFLAEDGTDEANGMAPETSNAPMPPSRMPSGGNAPVPPTKEEMANGEQTTTEEGAAGGAVDPSTDWGNILAQVLGAGGLAGTAYGLYKMGTKRMPPGTEGTAPYNDGRGGRVMVMPDGTSGVPDGGNEMPALRETDQAVRRQQLAAGQVPDEIAGEWRDARDLPPPNRQLPPPNRQLPPPSNVDASIDETTEEQPQRRVGQERRPQLEAPVDDSGVERTIDRRAGAAKGNQRRRSAREQVEEVTKPRGATPRPPRPPL